MRVRPAACRRPPAACPRACRAAWLEAHCAAHWVPAAAKLLAPACPVPCLPTQLYVPAEPLDCIDASANIWEGGTSPHWAGGSTPHGSALAGGGRRGGASHPSTDRLDVIAP